jgi:hypothetical protein
MSQLVKTKRQANFKDFKRFGAFKGLVEQKNVVFNSFVCKLGLFGTCGLYKKGRFSRTSCIFYFNHFQEVMSVLPKITYGNKVLTSVPNFHGYNKNEIFADY